MKSEPLSSFKISRDAKNRLKDKDYLKKQVARGKTAQQILGVNKAYMNEFYQAATELFERGRFAEAANAFLFLVTMNPRSSEYWLALGMCSQALEHYSDAIDSYELAAFYDVESPVPYIYMARCFFALKDRTNALESLNIAIEHAGDLDEFDEVRHQALEARSLLLKKKK